MKDPETQKSFPEYLKDVAKATTWGTLVTNAVFSLSPHTPRPLVDVRNVRARERPRAHLSQTGDNCWAARGRAIALVGAPAADFTHWNRRRRGGEEVGIPGRGDGGPQDWMKSKTERHRLFHVWGCRSDRNPHSTETALGGRDDQVRSVVPCSGGVGCALRGPEKGLTLPFQGWVT